VAEAVQNVTTEAMNLLFSYRGELTSRAMLDHALNLINSFCPFVGPTNAYLNCDTFSARWSFSAFSRLFSGQETQRLQLYSGMNHLLNIVRRVIVGLDTASGFRPVFISRNILTTRGKV